MKLQVLLLLLFSFVFTLPSFASKEKSDSAVVLKTKGDVFYYTGRFPEALDYYTRGLDKADSRYIALYLAAESACPALA